MTPQEIEVIYIGISAFLGAIVASLMGWAESQDPFDPRKFASSLIRAIIAGVGIAAAFNYVEPVTPVSYLLAFLSGAGVDAGGHRIASAIRAGLK